MNISKHAYCRAKERLGLSKQAFKRTVDIIIGKGYTHGELKGRLYKWALSHIMSTRVKPSIFIYGETMLIIKGESVVTVLKVPNNLTPINKFIKDSQ